MSDVEQTCAVRIQGLSYNYPAAGRALDDVSLSIDDGETVGLVGPSGAGKSTLLMHLNGLLPETVPKQMTDPKAATVQICGLPVCKPNLRQIRQLVGFLFQDPDDQLFCSTVREDVAFGPLNQGLPRDKVVQRVTDSLQAVDLEDFADRSTLQLSVGERKRVCLAGVFACRPSVLALDEPFGNLDPRARRSIIRILQSFQGSQIIATHDLNLVAELCPRVVILDEGRVQADGPTERILSDELLVEKHGLEVPLRYKTNC